METVRYRAIAEELREPDTPGARHGLRLVEDVVEVCLDSAKENMVSAMSLRASALLDARWNGWARPPATASAMRTS